MADQPAKALIVYGDGFMRHIGPSHLHLHTLSAAGSCGFLALRSQAPEATKGDDEVVDWTDKFSGSSPESFRSGKVDCESRPSHIFRSPSRIWVGRLRREWKCITALGECFGAKASTTETSAELRSQNGSGHPRASRASSFGCSVLPEAVTRRDDVISFGFEEFTKHSGNLTIFVDRFLHEVAFKLWRAPKYGA
ncbi:hypothetical protein R1sor_022663 [Riccia sorocarpa]|uniref:Uncharacterized protein n=1 Tax=Riccia sorocarpa TaxID=122646 RepID=A0ABD3GMI4_9MARC